MDLMNAMNLPAAPEMSRSSQPPRKKQGEEPLVSFPTMLERNARQETPKETSRTADNAESPTEKAPSGQPSAEEPAATPGSESTAEGGTSEVRPTTAAAAPGEVSPSPGQAAAVASEGQAAAVASEGQAVAVASEGQAVAVASEGQAVVPVPGAEVRSSDGVETFAPSHPEGPPTTPQAPAASAIPLDEVPEEALPDIQASGQVAAPGTSQIVDGSALPESPRIKPEAKAADPILPDSEAATDGELEGEISAPLADADTTSAMVDSGDGEMEIVEMETSEATATPVSAPAATQETASTMEGAAPAVAAEAQAQQTVTEEAQQAIKIQNAKKTYEQPQLATGTEEAKITLADLDLDSGSLDSFLSRDSLLTALKSAVAKTTPLHQHIRAQVSQQVVDHLRSEMAGQKLTLRLNPEELGQVEINFQALGDKLTISMSAEGKHAETALKDGARDLADSIGEKSSRFSMVEVRVETRGQQDQGRQETRQDDQRKERGHEQNASQQHEHHGGRQHQTAPHQTGPDEWAAFHLGGQ